jgi:ubiquinol-cytochrome c reductase cytochrome c subunit
LSWFKARRRHPAAGYAVLAGGLVVVALGYGALTATGGSAAAPAQSATDIANGRALFEATCSSCHGIDAQGKANVAPSLVGAGAAAVDFQMSTGRMPLKASDAEAARKPVTFSQQQIHNIAAYIESLGGGPTIPASSQVDTAGADTALGQQLFSTNCSQCHGFAGAGGALTYGAYAPALTASTPTQIYEAMLTGPEKMPIFGDGTITPAQKRDIIAYITATRAEPNPGGLSLGRTGPVTEGLVAWLAGLGFLILIALWLTAKRRDKVIETENHS